MRKWERSGSVRLLHMQTFCAIRHFDFNEVSSFAYEQLFETARMLNLPYPHHEQIIRRMVFNVLSRDCGDHTKNFVFLMDKNGKWSLAPAFDICHTYNPSNPWVSRQALSVNGKRSWITRNNFIAVADAMGIRKTGSIVKQVNDIVKLWDGWSQEMKVEESLRKTIKSNLIKL